MSNELRSPRYTICPADSSARAAKSWDSYLGNPSLSYFIGLHGDLGSPRIWLSGDRNMMGREGQSCALAQVPSCTTVSMTSTSAWSASIHGSAGNLLLGDGSVWQVSNDGLGKLVEQAVNQDPETLTHILKP